MFECQGVVLEGALQIGLRRMAGVACFGKKAQIGQTQLCHQALVCRQRIGISRATNGNLGKSQQKQCQKTGEEDERAV